MATASVSYDASEQRSWQRIKKTLRDNGLALTTAALFLAFAAGTLFVGAAAQNNELLEHGQAAIPLGSYVLSGHFLEALFENWESEFLQMGLLVLLTVRLFQRGSAESRDPDAPEKEEEPDTPRRDAPWPVRRGGALRTLYAHSLSISLLALFAMSFVLHGVSGLKRVNAENALHGEAPLRLGEYFLSAQFWYESLQNWQSEFLAVLAIVVLSIFLRERGSPQSKPVSAPHSRTGH